MKSQEVQAAATIRTSRKLKIFIWGIILSAGFGLLIFFGLPAFLSSSTGSAWLLGRVSQRLGGQLQTERLSVRWTRGVELSNLSYHDDSGVEVFQAARLAIQPRYWTVVTGAVDASIQIVDLRAGSLKPLFAMAGKELDMDGELKADVDITVAAGALNALKADVQIDHFSQGSGDERIVFDSPVIVTAKASGIDQDLAVEALAVQSDFCQVHCSGTQPLLDYEIGADLAKVMPFAGLFTDLQGAAFEGIFKARGTVNLGEQTIAMVTTASVDRLVVKKDQVQTPATDVTLKADGVLDQQQQRFRLASLDVTADPGTVKIRDLVCPLSDVTGVNSVAMDTQISLDLASLWSFAKVFNGPDGIDLAGVLNAKAAITTHDDQIRFQTDHTQLDGLRISRGQEALFQQDTVQFRGDVCLEAVARMVDIRILELLDAQGKPLVKVHKGTIQKEVTGETTRLTGAIDATYDLTAVSAFIADFMPDGLVVAGQCDDATLSFESTYPTDQLGQMMQTMKAAVTVGFDKASYNGLAFGETRLVSEIVDGVVDFTIPRATVNDGAFQLAGRVDLSRQPRILQLKQPMQILDHIHINEEMTQTMLKYLCPAFAGQSEISGVASLWCDQLEIPFEADRQDEIILDGRIEIDQMRLEAVGVVGEILEYTDNRSEFDAKLLPSRIVLRDGVLQYDQLELQFDQYPIGFAGKVYPDKRLDMQVLVPYKFDVERLRFPSVKVGGDLSQRLSLPVNGTVEQPRVRLEKLFDAILEKHQPDLIQRGLEELLKNL